MNKNSIPSKFYSGNILQPHLLIKDQLSILLLFHDIPKFLKTKIILSKPSKINYVVPKNFYCKGCFENLKELNDFQFQK